MENLPTIPEFYRGSKILITGGSGFMGKVLIEKLLRSCPDLDTIFLLLRARRNKFPADRIADIVNVPLFDRLKRENPSALSKIVSVSGDVTKLGLGLSEDDRQMLQREVNIVFHSAASVRFDDPIREAVLMNVRGAREMVELALGMKQLKVFLHVSTAFSNFSRPGIDVLREQLYPPPGDWRTMIKLAEMEGHDYTLRILAAKILRGMQNTYSYTKSLAEHMINDYRDRLPIVVVRPSIVICSMDEPMPGWIDNFNGPVGLWVAGWTGIMRTAWSNPDLCLDLVPVDTAMKSIICIAWHRAVVSQGPILPVYNCTTMCKPITQQKLLDKGIKIMKKYPTELTIWYPNPTLTLHKKVNFIKALLFQIIPSLVLDVFLKLQGKKPMIFNIQRKIFVNNLALGLFSVLHSYFDNSKFLEIDKCILASDKHAFSFSKQYVWDNSTIRMMLLGTKRYLLREQQDNMQSARTKLKRFYWMDQALRLTLLLIALWVIGACAKTRAAFHFFHSVMHTWVL